MLSDEKYPSRIHASTLSELLKTNLFLFKCIQQQDSQIHDLFMNMNTMYHQFMFMKQENHELKGLLEILAVKMGAEKEFFEKTRKNKQPKITNLHDDYTYKCSCGHIHHKDITICPKCGLDRSKKES